MITTTYFKQGRDELSIDEFRRQVRDRSGGMCELRLDGCHGRHAQSHHVLRKGQGGPNTLDNGLSLCNACHDFVHGPGVITGESYRMGWLRRRYPRPGDFYFEGE